MVDFATLFGLSSIVVLDYDSIVLELRVVAAHQARLSPKQHLKLRLILAFDPILGHLVRWLLHHGGCMLARLQLLRHPMLEYERSEFDTRLLHVGQIIVGCWRLLAGIPICYYDLFVRRCKSQNTIFSSLIARHIHPTQGVPLVRLLDCSLPAPNVITQGVLDVGHRADSIDHCRPLVIVFDQVVLVEELVGGDQFD